jgi:hypothetical protein
MLELLVSHLGIECTGKHGADKQIEHKTDCDMHPGFAMDSFVPFLLLIGSGGGL